MTKEQEDRLLGDPKPAESYSDSPPNPMNTALPAEEVKAIAKKHWSIWLMGHSDLLEMFESAISEALSRARSVTEGGTPRTDAELRRIELAEDQYEDRHDCYCELAKFTRSLELELSSRIPPGEPSPAILFQSSASGLWYQAATAAGSISAIRIGSSYFHIRDVQGSASSGELGELLKEVERLDQAATKGPWHASYERIVCYEHRAGLKDPEKRDGPHEVACTSLGGYDNARFTAFARTALPRLARELESAIVERDEWKHDYYEKEKLLNLQAERFHVEYETKSRELADALARLGEKAS